MRILLLFVFAVFAQAQTRVLSPIIAGDIPNTPIDSNSGGGCTGSSGAWTCTGAATITITDANSSTIFYTTNGTAPNCLGTSGTLYTAPFTGPGTTFTLKAIGCNGITGGGVLSSVYTISVSTTSRSFNGTSSDHLTNSTCYLSGATTFTVAFWIKSGNTAQTNAYLLNMYNGGWAPIYGFVNSGGKAQVEFYGPNGTGSDPRVGSQITISDTNWHHVAYRHTAGAAWDYFLDGTKTTINASITFSLSSTGSCTFEVGDASGGGNPANVSIARLYFSTAALSDGQISALAGATCSSSGVSGTTGYWLLGTASPDPESSPSPNTNSLTVTGTTTPAGPTCSSQ